MRRITAACGQEQPGPVGTHMHVLHQTAYILLASALLFAPPAYATSYSTDVSDLSWVPTESGWGMQLVQEGSTVYATLFVYGPTDQPTWAGATLQSHGQGSYIWSGSLYVFKGPWFGGTFGPSMVSGQAAGSMTFQLNTVSMGSLTYSINGTEVTKQVTRESLVLDDYTGNYTIGAHWLATACNSQAGNGDTAGPMNLVVNQSGTSMSMSWTFPSGAVCTYSGPYSQNGKLGAFRANYSCSNGDVGQLDLFETTNRAGMISARVSGQSTNLGCAYSGYFSGIDPSLPAQLN
jgi:hypothetical protein